MIKPLQQVASLSIMGTNGSPNITDGSNLFTPGNGYRVNVRGPRTLGCNLLYTTPNTPAALILRASGVVGQGTITLTNRVAAAPNPALSEYGYSLLGNAYPSELSWSSFRTANATVMSNSYWTYFVEGGQANNYSVYNNGTKINFPATIADGNVISSGQSFFVEKQTTGVGSVTFEEVSQNHRGSEWSFPYYYQLS